MLGLLVVPLVVGGIFFYLFRSVTWKEFLLQIGACTLLIAAGYFLARCGAMRDVEYHNGQITKKDHGTESCCHCRWVCVSRDQKGNCTSRVRTCDHAQDYWWALRTTVGTISVRDCSGSRRAPKTWSEAQVGDPASISQSYTNYLLADKESLIRREAESKYGKHVPKFPGISGLYKRYPVISHGVKIPPGWQDYFAHLNAKLGPSKQLDLVILLTKAKDPTYAQAVESKWLFGPKNAFTVVVGVEEDKVVWARGVSFSEASQLKIDIRDQLQDKLLLEIPPLIAQLVESKFQRTPMSKFEYLSKSATPSQGWMIFLYIFAVFLSTGIGVYMHQNDVFGDERR